MPFVSVRDDLHPHLVLDSNTNPIPWETGKLYEIGLASRYLRITARGLQYASFQHHDDADNAFRAPTTPWKSAPCNRTQGAMCQEGTPAFRMLYFSTGVVDLPDDMDVFKTGLQTEYVNWMMTHTCTNPKSGRAIVPADTTYELSLCDLLDNNLDIVLDLRKSIVYWRNDVTQTWVYILISVLAVWLVSSLAENVRKILMGVNTAPSVQKAQGNRWETLKRLSSLYNLMLLVCSIFVTYDLALGNVSKHIVHHADWNLYIVVFAFTAFSLFIPIAFLFNARSPSSDQQMVRGISLITGFLLLLSIRIHYTFDNPYTWTLVTIFGIRSWQKLLVCMVMNQSSEQNDKMYPNQPLPWLKLILHIIDAYVFILLISLAIQPSSDQAVEGELTVFHILFISLFTAMLTIHVIKPQHKN